MKLFVILFSRMRPAIETLHAQSRVIKILWTKIFMVPGIILENSIKISSYTVYSSTDNVLCMCLEISSGIISEQTSPKIFWEVKFLQLQRSSSSHGKDYFLVAVSQSA